MKLAQQATTAKKNSEVALSSFEYLVNEVVARMCRSTDGNANKNDHLEVAYKRLEQIGVEIGKRLAERLTRDKGRFPTDVECVRFLCKEFWQEINGKTADGLHRNKNNKGLFQVEDKNLRFLARISSDANSTTVKEDAQKYTVLASGMIKGALESFGYEAHVKCQITTIPGVSFSITLTQNSSI